jgi:oligopeptide/dipeptide ABC transporter ATP-binding protein
MILSIKNLSIYLPYRNTIRQVVRSVSFSLDAGETLGIVGESGCGKSLTNLAIMGLLPDYAQVNADHLVLSGHPLLKLNKKGWSQLRGSVVAMIFQNPMSSLNPTMTIGSQLLEALYRSEQKLSRHEAQERTEALLAQVGFPRPRNSIHAYPHELSGGMAQRVMIAMAVALKPALLIADEPTTALDVTTQQQIMNLLHQLCREYAMSMILVSHDIGLVHRYTDRLHVMYAGEFVETGPACSIITQPSHPYTKGLIASQPGYSTLARKTPLPSISGQVPTMDHNTPGCRFADRCPIVDDHCQMQQKLVPHFKQPDVSVRCGSWSIP